MNRFFFPRIGLLLALAASPAAWAQGTPFLEGVYHGEHRLTMRGCPGACVAGQELVLGYGVQTAPWTWNFDEGWAEITGTTLTVGFDYHVQDLGNADPERDIAYFTDNGDGTYTLQHGFQIYNPNVGNPRTETYTVFRITRDAANPNLLNIESLDGDNPPDGITGTQIVGVFPMTVQPGFVGTARLEGSSSSGDGLTDELKTALGLNPDSTDTDGDGISDVNEIGDDVNNPLDSDGDGIIDALEPGAAATDATVLGGVALLGGTPGVNRDGDEELAGETVRIEVDAAWRFTGAQTGLMQLASSGDEAAAIPDTTLGDAGLDYRHGFVQFSARSAATNTGTATLRFVYSAALPDAQSLVVYASQRVDGKERYTLLGAGHYTRVDDHTLEVRFADNGERDYAAASGVLRGGIAPAENTLGGHEFDSGNGGGGSAGWLAALLGAWVVARRRAAARA